MTKLRVHCSATTLIVFFFSSRRRHTRYIGDWSSDVCSSDLGSRLPEARQPFVVGIPVIGRVTCGLPQSRDDVRRRRRVGIPDPEVDQVDAAGRHLAFETVDFSEEVGWKLLDSFGFFDRYGQGETPGSPASSPVRAVLATRVLSGPARVRYAGDASRPSRSRDGRRAARE